MRKFRVYLKSEKKYMQLVSILFHIDGIKIDCKYKSKLSEWIYFKNVAENEFVLEQFTGLYDKNNNPGYDGDIVKYKTRSYSTDEKSIYTLGVIIWDEMKAGFYIAPIHMYEYFKSGRNKSFRGEHLNLKTKEIIGNIHQNKNLLK